MATPPTHTHSHHSPHTHSTTHSQFYKYYMHILIYNFSYFKITHALLVYCVSENNQEGVNPRSTTRDPSESGQSQAQG